MQQQAKIQNETTAVAMATQLKIMFQYLEKKYGKGIIMNLGEKQISNVPVIPTGSVGLNIALGTGGYPQGRIVEIFGPEASGKTTLAMHAIANVQKSGKRALLVDTEHAFDKNYAEQLGIDVQNMLICQPDYGEQALDVIEYCIKTEVVGIVVLDSVSALIPEAELQGEIGDHNMAGQARLMSKAMRKLTAIINKAGVICLFINQLRHKIGFVFGSSEVTPGGNALKYHASVRLDIRNIGAIKDKDGVKIGQKTRVRVVKNKLAAPFKEAMFDIIYGKGIAEMEEIVDIAVSLGLIQKSGAWFSYEGKRMGQGKEAVVQYMKENEKMQSELMQKMNDMNAMHKMNEMKKTNKMQGMNAMNMHAMQDMNDMNAMQKMNEMKKTNKMQGMNAMNMHAMQDMNDMNAMQKMNEMKKTNNVQGMNAMNMQDMNDMNAMQKMNEMKKTNNVQGMNAMNMHAMQDMNDMNAMQKMNEMKKTNKMQGMNAMNMNAMQDMKDMNAMQKMNEMKKGKNMDDMKKKSAKKMK